MLEDKDFVLVNEKFNDVVGWSRIGQPFKWGAAFNINTFNKCNKIPDGLCYCDILETGLYLKQTFLLFH